MGEPSKRSSIFNYISSSSVCLFMLTNAVMTCFRSGEQKADFSFLSSLLNHESKWSWRNLRWWFAWFAVSNSTAACLYSLRCQSLNIMHAVLDMISKCAWFSHHVILINSYMYKYNLSSSRKVHPNRTFREFLFFFGFEKTPLPGKHILWIQMSE